MAEKILALLVSGDLICEFGDAANTDHPGTCTDTHINIDETNYSTEETLNVYTWPVNTIANAVIIKWDISALPASKVIASATLSLYMTGFQGSAGDDPYTVTVHRIENVNPTITLCEGKTYDGTNAWTNVAAADFPLAQEDIATAESTVNLNTTLEYKTFDVTQMVRDWYNGDKSNFGMLINSDATAVADSDRQFASTEHANPNERPKLIVHFTTEADTTAPQISSISAGTPTDTTATITWTTNESADSQVEYGLTASYGSSTTLDGTNVTSHSQQITGLTAGTTYHYKVKSTDPFDNASESSDQTFATVSADTTDPIISDIAESNLTDVAVTITWTTDEDADSQIDYGTTDSYGSSTTLDGTLETSHSQVITGLQNNTLYHYQVKSSDASGNEALGADGTFTTTTPSQEWPNEPAGFTKETERNFNSVNDDEGWNDVRQSAGLYQVTSDTTAPKSSNNVGEIIWSSGTAGGGAPAYTNYQNITGGISHMYISFWYKLSSNWDGHSSGVNKIGFCWIHSNPVVYFDNHGSGSGPYTPQVRLQNTPGGARNLTTNVASFNIQRGQWYRWEIELKINTGGNTDGEAHWWIDGIKVGAYTDIGYSSSGQGHEFELVSWRPIWGGTGDSKPAQDNARMDHFYISRA